MQFHDYQISRHDMGRELLVRLLTKTRPEGRGEIVRLFKCGDFDGVRRTVEQSGAYDDEAAEFNHKVQKVYTAEKLWEACGKVYYKVWPMLLGPIEKFRLDVRPVDLPIPTADGKTALAMRFPKQPPLIRPLAGDTYLTVQSVLATWVWEDGELLLRLLLQCESSAFPDKPLLTAESSVFRPDETIADHLQRYRSLAPDDSPFRATLPDDIFEESSDSQQQAVLFEGNDYSGVSELMYKCLFTIFAIGNDPSLVTPDVLGKDRDRYESETDEEWKRRAEQRARNRGVHGYNLGGEKLEQAVHYRNGCPALYWVGKGRRQAKIRWRNGCVVHREKAMNVPTGYYDESGKEVDLPAAAGS